MLVRNASTTEGMYRVSLFHAITREVVELGDPVVPVTCRFLGFDPDQSIRADRVRELFRRYTDAIANDIGLDQARLIGTALADNVWHDGMPRTWRQLLSGVESAYHAVGNAWASLLTAFLAAVIRECRRHGVTDIVFLARDGILLDVVHRSAHEARRDGITDWILDLNRGMVGVNSSNERDPVPDEVLIRHIRASVPLGDGVAIVDTGLYGTMVHALVRLGLLGDSLVMFFSSRNPYVYGFLQAVGVSSAGRDLATLCCDTLESWPKPYRTARLAADGDSVVAVAEAADPISMCAHLTLARSLADRSGRLDPDEVDPAAELAILDGLQALGTAGGAPVLLPRAVKQWPDAVHFLGTEWDIGPVPPLTSPRLEPVRG